MPHEPKIRGVGVSRDCIAAQIFRPTPLPNYAGGRDDGVYTSMAAHLTRAPAAIHRDPTVLDPTRDGHQLYGDFGVTPNHHFSRRPEPTRAGRYVADDFVL